MRSLPPLICATLIFLSAFFMSSISIFLYVLAVGIRPFGALCYTSLNSSNYNTKSFSKLYFTVVLCGSIGTRKTTSAPPRGPVKMLQKIVGGTAATDGVCRFQFDYFMQKHLISSVCAHSNSHIRWS